MDPKNQPQLNSKTPISEVLKQEKEGFVSSAPKSSYVVDVADRAHVSTNDLKKTIESANSSVRPEEPSIVPFESKVKIIKTYRSDAAEAVKMQEQASVAKIALAQEAQRREQGEEIGVEESPKKKIGLLAMAIILLALGAVAIPTVKYILDIKKQEVPITSEKTILPFDNQENLVLANATRNNLFEVLDTLTMKQRAVSKIEYRKVYEKILTDDKKTTTRKIATDTFAYMIGPNMPSALARSLDSDYMYGIWENQKPFIIFKTSSYQQTFANMLKWEPKMISDLSPVLSLDAGTPNRFTDGVVMNKDTRAVTAQDGTILFLYGFLDNQTLVITTSQQAFQDLSNRYTATRFIQ